MELIKSRNGEVRAAKVLLTSRHTLQRSLCQLFPLKCDDRLGNSDENTQTERTSIDKRNVEGKHQNRKQPRRQAEKEPRDKIYGQYLEDD